MSDFTYVLGVPNFANYEASASLIRVPRGGGEIAYVSIPEDRLTRTKHTYAFPLRGIQYCLDAFGLESIEQIDFIYTDYASEHPQALAELESWVKAGKIRVQEDLVDGLENAPTALVGLLAGENRGKRIVRIAQGA